MNINVTKEDIQQGIPRHPSNCPVGRALSRAGVALGCVMGEVVIVAPEQQRPTALLLPETVQRWIGEFDGGKPVEPIAFEVGLPVPITGNCSTPCGNKPLRCSPSRTPKAPHVGCPILSPTH